LELPVDPNKCNYWAVSVQDVNDVIHTAVGGKASTEMIEGEKRFDISLRFPERLRNSEEAILNIPVDVYNNRVTSAPTGASKNCLAVSGIGSSLPSLCGTSFGAGIAQSGNIARRRLGDLVTPLGLDGKF